MIVYNLSMHVQESIEEEWVKWQQEEHIPEIMQSGQFTGYKFYRLLEQEPTGSTTYVIQYFATDMDHYQTYVRDFAPPLRQKALTRWNDRFIAFRTIMEPVN